MSAGCVVTVVSRNGRAIVSVGGEVDLTARERIHNALGRAQEGSTDVIVDLSQVAASMGRWLRP
jgi:hypothetical protein